MRCEALEDRAVPTYLPVAPDGSGSTTEGESVVIIVQPYDPDGGEVTEHVFA